MDLWVTPIGAFNGPVDRRVVVEKDQYSFFMCSSYCGGVGNVYKERNICLCGCGSGWREIAILLNVISRSEGLFIILLLLQDGVGGDYRAEDEGAHVRQSNDGGVRLGPSTGSSRVSWVYLKNPENYSSVLEIVMRWNLGQVCLGIDHDGVCLGMVD